MNILIISIAVVALVLLAAACSGLNVALMSLNIADLRRKSKLGNKAAKKVLPLRQNSHLTLAGILLTNVAAVSITSVLIESETGGIIAVIVSTLLMVIFGEILPQAFFSKRALTLCARFSPLLKVMIFITYPISKPLQILLDKILGSTERSQLQTRHELGIMITEHLGDDASELDEDEVEIVRGALQLSEKQVGSIMTPIEKVYWLTPDTVIDADKIDEIKAKGFSRIPIFNSKLTKCFGILLMKDLVDIDFDESARSVLRLPLYSAKIVGSKTALDTMFRKLVNGGTHLMPIERDDKIIGVVTIEDLIEEIVGHEIEDEIDRTKRQASKA